MATPYECSEYVINEVKKAVKGKDDCIKKAFATILARGHILIEDVPGVGKTTLAMAFSNTMGLKNQRVQFTPDVMPADILGFSMYKKETGVFEYKEGPIMCNLFLADEINRTSPKTQSALLEVMEEDVVTIDGVRHPVPKPFVVMATQNPKGSAGTQLLPESQLDRFMISLSMGYPDLENEIAIAKGKSVKQGMEQIRGILNPEALLQMQDVVEQVYMHDHIYTYICKLIQATRDNSYVELGLSPRGTIALVRLAKAWAFLNERNYVTPDDVCQVFTDVGKHRLVLNTKARVAHVTEEMVLLEILQKVKQPTTYMEKKDYRG